VLSGWAEQSIGRLSVNFGNPGKSEKDKGNTYGKKVSSSASQKIATSIEIPTRLWVPKRGRSPFEERNRGNIVVIYQKNLENM